MSDQRITILLNSWFFLLGCNNVDEHLPLNQAVDLCELFGSAFRSLNISREFE